MWWQIIRVIIVFPFVIVLLLFTLKSIQKLSGAGVSNKNMKLIEQLRLTPKATLSIVKIGPSYVVISCSDEQVQVVRELLPEEVTALEENQQTFGLENLDTTTFKDVLSRWKRE